MATAEERHCMEQNGTDAGLNAREHAAESPGPGVFSGGERVRGAPDQGAVSERLARFMFDLQADEYEADDAMRELAWADDNVHDFWLGQAGAVFSFLGLERRGHPAIWAPDAEEAAS